MLTCLFSVKQEAWETGENDFCCTVSTLTSSLPDGFIFCTQEKKRRRNEEEEEETPEKRQKAPSPTSLEEEELCSDHTAVCSTKVCVPEAALEVMAAITIEHLSDDER